MSKRTKKLPQDRCEIGKIIAAHGVRGDMLLLPQTDFPERFLDMKKLDVTIGKKPMRRFNISRIEPYEGKGTFFLHLVGIEDRDAAEAMRGATITIAKDDRVELEEDEYWLEDIIGLVVVSSDTGEKLGVVSEVLYTGSNDVYVVKTIAGAEKAVPAVADVVKDIDLEKGTMTVDIPEGLWD